MAKKHFSISNIFFRLLLFLWGMTILFPLVWVIYESLKTNREFFENPWSLPKSLKWINYKIAFETLQLGPALLNTVYYVFMSMVIGIIVTTLCAYVLSRMQWKGRKLVWSLIMLSLLLPGINILVPQYVMMCKFHLNDSLNGLVFLNSIGMNAFDLMLLGGFMKSIPKELEESAFIDGATITQTFKSIIVPLSVPGIVTISIFRFIALYNDFMGPFIYLADDSKHTIGVKMFYANQIMQYDNNYTGLFAGVIIAMIPSLLIYILFQKSIVQGATMGAVKG